MGTEQHHFALLSVNGGWCEWQLEASLSLTRAQLVLSCIHGITQIPLLLAVRSLSEFISSYFFFLFPFFRFSTTFIQFGGEDVRASLHFKFLHQNPLSGLGHSLAHDMMIIWWNITIKRAPNELILDKSSNFIGPFIDLYHFHLDLSA